MRQSITEKWNVHAKKEINNVTIKQRFNRCHGDREKKLTVHTTGNAFSLAGRVEWSRPSSMTATYTKMHPKAVILLSFGLDNLIALYVRHKLCMCMEESEMIHCIRTSAYCTWMLYCVFQNWIKMKGRN